MTHKLPDTNQSFWDLAVIQLTGVTSLPVLTASILLIQMNSFGNAVLNIVIGNILLWFLRYGILSMSYKDRKSTLDISKDYVGNFGGYFIAILLLVSTLAWFVVQTTLASNALTHLIRIEEGTGINRFIQISVVLGMLSTLFCMEGIVVLRWLCLIAFPIIVASFLAVIFASPHIPRHEVPMALSFAGLPLVLSTSLGVTADLPTFFRHSRSWKASVMALTTIQVASLLIGFGGLFLGYIITPWLGINAAYDFTAGGEFLRLSLIVLIIVSVVCANVSNVYSASVGWELVAPALAGRKEYLILGLGLTTIFVLISNIFSLNFLLETADSSLVDLCIVLVIGYLIHLKTKKSPKFFEQTIYFLAWLISSIVNILQFSNVIPGHAYLVVGCIVIVVTIGCGFALKEVLKNFERKKAA